MDPLPPPLAFFLWFANIPFGLLPSSRLEGAGLEAHQYQSGNLSSKGSKLDLCDIVEAAFLGSKVDFLRQTC